MSTPPYTIPTELLEKANRELTAATASELESAGRAYEAYNAAAGGRSAVTGAPLPSWEQNKNPLVRYAWLEAHRQQMAEACREVDGLARELRQQRREVLNTTLSDPRMVGLFESNWLTLMRRLAENDAEEVPGMLLRLLLERASRGAKEQERDTMFRTTLAAAFNGMAEACPLSQAQQKLLDASANLLEDTGHKGSAEFIRDCARGQASVDMEELERAGMKAEVPKERDAGPHCGDLLERPSFAQLRRGARAEYEGRQGEVLCGWIEGWSEADGTVSIGINRPGSAFMALLAPNRVPISSVLRVTRDADPVSCHASPQQAAPVHKVSRLNGKTDCGLNASNVPHVGSWEKGKQADCPTCLKR